jgi:hypothetical protein
MLVGWARRRYIKCPAALSFYSFDPEDGDMFIRNVGNTLHLKIRVNMNNNPPRQLKGRDIHPTN